VADAEHNPCILAPTVAKDDLLTDVGDWDTEPGLSTGFMRRILDLLRLKEYIVAVPDVEDDTMGTSGHDHSFGGEKRERAMLDMRSLKISMETANTHSDFSGQSSE
jgi:hypothetical protein